MKLNPHKLAFIYLLAPIPIFLGMWVNWHFSLPIMALLLISLFLFLKTKIDYTWPTKRELIGIIVIAIITTITAPISNIMGHHGWDLIKHKGTYIDLLGDPIYLDGTFQLIVHNYYFAYYLVPIILAPNSFWLNILIPFHFFIGMIIIFLLIYPIIKFIKWKIAGIVIIIFAFPAFIMFTMFVIFIFPNPERIGDLPLSIVSAPRISGILETLHFSPNTFFISMIGILFIYNLRNTKVLKETFPLLLAISLLWSPFITIGIILYTPLVYGFRVPKIFTIQIATAILLGLIVSIFFITNMGNYSYFLWEKIDYRGTYTGFGNYLKHIGAYLVIFLPMAGILLSVKEIRNNKWVIASLIILLLTPILPKTYGLYNDFSMRVSFPSVIIFVIFSLYILNLKTFYSSSIKFFSIRKSIYLIHIVVMLIIVFDGFFILGERQFNTPSDYEVSENFEHWPTESREKYSSIKWTRGFTYKPYTNESKPLLPELYTLLLAEDKELEIVEEITGQYGVHVTDLPKYYFTIFRTGK